MVRRFWQNRLVQGVVRLARLFVRWILVWLSYLARGFSRNLRVFGRILLLLVNPRSPNNLFVLRSEASHEADEAVGAGDAAPEAEGVGGGLLWAGEIAPGAGVETEAVSLWRGQKRVSADDAAPGAAAANRRYAYLDLLAVQLKRLSGPEFGQLDEIVTRLARKWLDVDQSFEQLPRRNRLDIGRTLRHNIPRYAGKVLNFKWAVKERPIPKLSKPARILVIGDVSHSMVHYMCVVLYFMHKLNFRFVVDSYVFSEKATHATPFLAGLGTFDEKVARLVSGAKSWNAGTRFGSALEDISQHARVDEYTYVIIGTDGKISVQGDESDKIKQYMTALRGRAKQVIFLTPSVEFSEGAAGKRRAPRAGAFKYEFHDIPIFENGPPLWYGILGQYADRLYLVRTVQDLIDMTEDLIMASQG